MAWMYMNQQAQNCFASLGTWLGDTYAASPDCISILTEINKKLTNEDRTLRTFRRTIGFSEALKKDFLPLLVSVKDYDVISATIKILVNLSVPVECLLPIEAMSRTDSGRMTIFELNSFLLNSKEAFVDPKTTRAIVDYMKKIIEMEEKQKLSEDDCESINNCLLLLRNVLHIPEARMTGQMHPHTTVQNQILWNLFIQNIDKVLIHLMNSEQKSYWGVTMVQLIAVMYKDQHVGTLQKLLNVWLEASISESSEDNESNTSPPDNGGSDSSPMLTSDPTSDSSDTGGGNKIDTGNHEGSSGVPVATSELMIPLAGQLVSASQHVVQRKPLTNSTDNAGKTNAKKGGADRKGLSSGSSRKAHNKISSMKRSNDADSGAASLCSSDLSINSKVSNHHVASRSKPGQTSDGLPPKWECFSSEMSDCGYATQAENPELVSTSSNEEDAPHKKRPVHHQKHHIQKTRYSNKQPSPQEKKELRRKKLVKRSRTAIMNMKAMAHHTPTDEDITHVLKEFTVDFLLKAYGPLVRVLHGQLLASHNLVRVDTSHFFWLVTYFLKFAAQLELDLEHIRDVLSYDILSYLTYEAVNICESLEMVARQEGANLKPCLRRQHLVVTAIREFLQAVETYGRIAHLSSEDRDFLRQLQCQIVATDDLKCMFVLLLRQYNPNIHNKQYLQDVIVTNHVLLLFLENSKATQGQLEAHQFGVSMIEHMKQFASVEVMRQYGILLEDFEVNGEFVNDCLFTMMHHIGGDMDRVESLFQPNILKTFTQMWETDFELCDDWSDLIEYVIHKFTNYPPHCLLVDPPTSGSNTPAEDFGWSKEECENLYWYFAQSSTNTDPVSSIVKQYAEDGVPKTRMAVVRRLMEQGLISDDEYQNLLSGDTSQPSNMWSEEAMELDSSDKPLAEGIEHLREALVKDNRGAQLVWLQRVLMETCYVKLAKDVNCQIAFDLIARPFEPIPQYYSHLNQSIPLVLWSQEQETVFLQRPFQLLLHKLGFHLPADTGKVFARIPSFWTVDVLLSVAQKLGPIDASKLKFEMKDLMGRVGGEAKKQDNSYKQAVEPEPSDNHQFAVPRTKTSSLIIKYTPVPNPTSWLDIVKSSVRTPLTALATGSDKEEPEETACTATQRTKDSEVEDSDIASVCSICETSRESVASDLTRMCVSDEDEVTAKD